MEQVELSKMVEGGVPFAMASDPVARSDAAYGVYDDVAGVESGDGSSSIPDGVVRE